MDIIDIMLAKALTPQGQVDTYAARARQAAQNASAAQANAAAAAQTLEDAAQTKKDAEDALSAVQAALSELAGSAIEDIDAEVKKLTIETNLVPGQSANTVQLISTYPDNTLATKTITKLYKNTGNNEDGTMTQKAISDALAQKADASALATKADASALAAKADKTYVDEQIAAIPTSGGGNATIDTDANDADHLVKVDENGNIVPSLITEESVIEALLNAGTYIARDAVGLDIDYANKTCTRVQEAVGKSMGNDFNSYSMYGGRVKCNVADNGTINAFYGDNNYTEDGSNGQVMIYQPKFYYKRIIRAAEELVKGKVVRHETLIISPTEQPGFKLAPIFNGDLDYVLFPAYDASVVNNKLTSIAGVKPINNLTRDQAEAYATARGTGWHIMTMAAESANQMLEMVEFGSMNGQSAIESGITYIPEGSNGLCLFITGSTASLGNGTGHATETTMDVEGVTSTTTENGMRAIIYRGMENPWGNLWSMIGGVIVSGNGTNGGGTVNICKDFNYSGNNYEDIGFNLPSIYGWVNAMGYGNEDYDWVYLPIECSQNANSLAPVGDYLWTVSNLSDTVVLATGGSFGFKEECGPFYYAADRNLPESARHNYGAKLLYIPTKNSTYTANVAKWTTHMGG